MGEEGITTIERYYANYGVACYVTLACVAGIQRGGRGEVECEREARSLGSQLPPPSPLYAGHLDYVLRCMDSVCTFKVDYRTMFHNED